MIILVTAKALVNINKLLISKYKPANTYEAHVHDASRAGEDVTSHVHVAPNDAQRPVT